MSRLIDGSSGRRVKEEREFLCGGWMGSRMSEREREMKRVDTRARRDQAEE